LVGDDKTVAEDAIEKTEEFFNSLGVMTRINDYTSKCYLIWEIPPRFKERGWKLGEKQNVDHLKVEEILKTRM